MAIGDSRCFFVLLTVYITYAKMFYGKRVNKVKYVINYENKIKELLGSKKYLYYIDTMGCALNENDSMKYSGIMAKMGMERTYDVDKANIILFNTCAIRENAEDKLYGRLGMLKKRKQQEPNLYICIVGCMSQQEHVIAKIKESYRFVDVLLGTHSMHDFAKSLYMAMKEKKKIAEYVEDKTELVEDIPIIYEDGVRASVSIIYGCNNFCSYCIVPYVRGREKSRLPEDIISDIKYLAENGYKEITLLGQNVNSYGNDFRKNNIDNLKEYTFVKLLKEIDKIPGIEVIKFMSPHPKDFSDELIEYIAENTKISRQIHLPLQSGSTEILNSMNRKYTKESYMSLVEKMKNKIPDVSFSTDIIVGFPGETEEDFLETLAVVKEVKFSQIYMFIYSIRKGTVGEKMPNQIDEKIKGERLERLKKIFEESINEENETYVGKTFKILVEGKSKNNEKMYTGRTNSNKVVVFEAAKEDVGKVKDIKIIKNNLWYLTGQIL